MIALTGSHGFVGQALIGAASRNGMVVRALSRAQYTDPAAYRSCRAAIHLAGLAHRRHGYAGDFDEVNHRLCIAAANAAAAAGVKRFVMVSSSKALRDYAQDETALSEDERPMPGCDYGRSKLAAETELLTMTRTGVIECVIVRPSLIIGAPAKANLATLGKLAAGKFDRLAQCALDGFSSQRSVTALSNLIEAIWVLCDHPAASGEIFHVVEDRPISAANLMKGLRSAAARTPATWDNTPQSKFCGLASLTAPAILRFALLLMGRSQSLNALDRPLVLDGRKIQQKLGWHPQACLESELQRIMSSLANIEEAKKG